MTAFHSTTLTCDRDTRPPIDGIRTVCGRPFEVPCNIDRARHLAREAGWAATGTRDFCPDHGTAMKGSA